MTAPDLHRFPCVMNGEDVCDPDDPEMIPCAHCPPRDFYIEAVFPDGTHGCVIVNVEQPSRETIASLWRKLVRVAADYGFDAHTMPVEHGWRHRGVDGSWYAISARVLHHGRTTP